MRERKRNWKRAREKESCWLINLIVPLEIHKFTWSQITNFYICARSYAWQSSKPIMLQPIFSKWKKLIRRHIMRLIDCFVTDYYKFHLTTIFVNGIKEVMAFMFWTPHKWLTQAFTRMEISTFKVDRIVKKTFHRKAVDTRWMSERKFPQQNKWTDSLLIRNNSTTNHIFNVRILLISMYSLLRASMETVSY